MKMSPTDRLNAIKRHPEFIRDYEELTLIRKTNDNDSILSAEMKICKKWGETVSRIENAEALKDKRPFSCVKVVNSIERKPIVKFQYSDGQSQQEWTQGEALYLEIDPTASMKDLLRDFKQIINSHQGQAKQPGRERETTLNPWDIYDRYSQSHNFLKITREIFKAYKGIKDNPARDQKPDAYYKQVLKAYKKATKMINEVTPPGLPIPYQFER